MSELRTRDVVESDLPAVLAIRSRSFGPLGVGGEDWWRRVSAETLGGRMIAVVDGSDTVLGAGRIRPYEQAWGGRHLRMGGVAGVYVEPSARGRGVATTLTRALVARMAELGDVVSCLFPTTATLYRRSGYEIGGTQTRTTYAAHVLRDLGSAGAGHATGKRPERPRTATTGDAQQMHDLAREAHARHASSGPMVPSVAAFRGMLERDEVIAYVLGDGFVVYGLSDDAVTVEHLVAATPESATTLWGLVGSGSSAAPTVHTYLDPRDPVTLAIGGLAANEVQQVPWMARVVDLEAAVSGRSFATHTSVEASLVVDDPDVPANSGHWTVGVTGGRGTATRTDDASTPRAGSGGAAASTARREPLRVDARGLSALWCGWSVSRLRQAGLATGGDADGDAALDAVFASTPYITEYF
ncbi:enhanced intracellular survival protein Eis [Terrabacter sp. MAHUQ-38]|jgi:predicted acetyltransferase|uniref:GNAT family N-acetyltransferase n=1 Tax=unclassified Terrabacter TaxID=2630222 RepID=UPI00165D74A3|nr:GNAT family N-acetyltransferase [Terrabacter sp. MAHUQ-38]MBC9822588.1 GNAT family N-acetyltransferase [Terrabacter sp. MAHUQ-38]